MAVKILRKVNTRLGPGTASPKLIPLESGQSFNLKRIAFGEMYRGSNVWLVDHDEVHIWSGAADLRSISNPTKSSAFNEFSVMEMWQHSQGEGVKVGIIDCGINEGHICLKETRKKIINAGSSVCMHGTYMASIVAGTDAKNGFLGVAPKADLIFTAVDDVKTVKPKELQARMESLVDADIISMSFSLRDGDFATSKPAGKQLQELINSFSSNKIIVAAAGNLGGIDDVYYPANYDNVISVSAYSESNKQVAHEDANFWDGIKLVGPFQSYFDLAADAKQVFPMKESLRGTSATTAFVSALFALVVSRWKITNQPISKDKIIESCCIPVEIFSDRSNRIYKTFQIDKQKIIQTLKT